MSDQLTLIEPDAPRLTQRQLFALEHLGGHSPLGSGALGALLHEYRLGEGGRGHGRDDRCDWCATEGAQMGRRLRTLGHVRYRRGLGWVLAGAPAARSVVKGAYDPSKAPFPPGY